MPQLEHLSTNHIKILNKHKSNGVRVWGGDSLRKRETFDFGRLFGLF